MCIFKKNNLEDENDERSVLDSGRNDLIIKWYKDHAYSEALAQFLLDRPLQSIKPILDSLSDRRGGFQSFVRFLVKKEAEEILVYLAERPLDLRFAGDSIFLSNMNTLKKKCCLPKLNLSRKVFLELIQRKEEDLLCLYFQVHPERSTWDYSFLQALFSSKLEKAKSAFFETEQWHPSTDISRLPSEFIRGIFRYGSNKQLSLLGSENFHVPNDLVLSVLYEQKDTLLFERCAKLGLLSVEVLLERFSTGASLVELYIDSVSSVLSLPLPELIRWVEENCYKSLQPADGRDTADCYRNAFLGVLHSPILFSWVKENCDGVVLNNWQKIMSPRMHALQRLRTNNSSSVLSSLKNGIKLDPTNEECFIATSPDALAYIQATINKGLSLHKLGEAALIKRVAQHADDNALLEEYLNYLIEKRLRFSDLAEELFVLKSDTCSVARYLHALVEQPATLTLKAVAQRDDINPNVCRKWALNLSSVSVATFSDFILKGRVSEVKRFIQNFIKSDVKGEIAKILIERWNRAEDDPGCIDLVKTYISAYYFVASADFVKYFPKYVVFHYAKQWPNGFDDEALMALVDCRYWDIIEYCGSRISSVSAVVTSFVKSAPIEVLDRFAKKHDFYYGTAYDTYCRRKYFGD